MQEAHDFALVAHAATLRVRVPFLHFFDGFRTSHEIDKIAVLDDDDLRALVRDDDVVALRARGMTPEAPRRARHRAEPRRVLPGPRGGATRSTSPYPTIVAEVMDELAARTGRRYGLVDYHGAPDAERVIVRDGIGRRRGRGDRRRRWSPRASPWAWCSVRLFQPFPAERARRRAAADGAVDRGARPHEGAGRGRRAAVPRRSSRR